MLPYFKLNTQFIIPSWLLLLVMLVIAISPDLIAGLTNVAITIPSSIRRGDNAIMLCNYDLENDTLYTVKWYKGRREFFRYTPKENPSMQIFSASGITVERLYSNQSHVVLSRVQFNASGKYQCEVSADAPSFHTIVAHSEMEVVELPAQRPIITGIQTRYRLGDIINGNCSSDFSKPSANLTWTINEIPVIIYKGQKNPIDELLEASILEINLIVNHMHFVRGRLLLKCNARIYDIYNETTEKLIEEDRPLILASGRSPNLNLMQFNQDGEMNDQSEHLTHYKADMASLASSLTTQSSILSFIGNFYKFIKSTTTTISSSHRIFPVSIKTTFSTVTSLNVPFTIVVLAIMMIINFLLILISNDSSNNHNVFFLVFILKDFFNNAKEKLKNIFHLYKDNKMFTLINDLRIFSIIRDIQILYRSSSSSIDNIDEENCNDVVVAANDYNADKINNKNVFCLQQQQHENINSQHEKFILDKIIQEEISNIKMKTRKDNSLFNDLDYFCFCYYNNLFLACCSSHRKCLGFYNKIFKSNKLNFIS